MSPSPAAANRSEVGGPLPGLGADLLAVVARLNRLATQRIQMPLPAAQARLLATIEAQGEARIGDLAAVDHCSQPTMTTQVRRLEDAGLVTRTADPGDARAVRIRITPEGIRTLTAVRADRAAAIEPSAGPAPTGGPPGVGGCGRRVAPAARPCRHHAGPGDAAIGIEMSNAAPLAVWVGSMRPKTQRESLGGSCCWSCPDHPDYSERPMRAG
ncbi:MarR family transcriptional regulator [Mycobacterium tuberculosis]|nr:MarR family transcriptional regulator [Mycobacterium tuberculosis]